MHHPERTWAVVDVASDEEFAHNLVEQVYTRCTGFRFDGYLFLNDSEREDGHQEYVILRESDLLHVGNLLLRATKAIAEQSIATMLEIGFPDDGYGTMPADRIQSVAEHGRCPLCA
jgi:hypothetical protein